MRANQSGNEADQDDPDDVRHDRLRNEASK
jgi:hypothetical protein